MSGPASVRPTTQRPAPHATAMPPSASGAPASSLLLGWPLRRLGSGLLGLKLRTDLLDLIVTQHLQLLVLAQHSHFDVLAARLDHLQQSAARELDAIGRRPGRVREQGKQDGT